MTSCSFWFVNQKHIHGTPSHSRSYMYFGGSPAGKTPPFSTQLHQHRSDDIHVPRETAHQASWTDRESAVVASAPGDDSVQRT